MDTEIKVQPSLNRGLWKEDNTLNPEVRAHLLVIAADFLKDLNLPKESIEDIVITGSLASQLWTPQSDLDLHVIVDKANLGIPADKVDVFLEDAKSLWNLKHHIPIKGFPIEIYLQGSDEVNVTPGVYSVLNNKWVKEPDLSDAPVVDTDSAIKKAKHFIKKISALKALMDSGNFAAAREGAEALRLKIRQFRDAGLHSKGILSPENLSFKYLRRAGWLDLLRNIDIESYDRLMSIDKSEMLNDDTLDILRYLIREVGDAI